MRDVATFVATAAAGIEDAERAPERASAARPRLRALEERATDVAGATAADAVPVGPASPTPGTTASALTPRAATMPAAIAVRRGEAPGRRDENVMKETSGHACGVSCRVRPSEAGRPRALRGFTPRTSLAATPGSGSPTPAPERMLVGDAATGAELGVVPAPPVQLPPDERVRRYQGRMGRVQAADDSGRPVVPPRDPPGAAGGARRGGRARGGRLRGRGAPAATTRGTAPTCATSPAAPTSTRSWWPSATACSWAPSPSAPRAPRTRGRARRRGRVPLPRASRPRPGAPGSPTRSWPRARTGPRGGGAAPWCSAPSTGTSPPPALRAARLPARARARPRARARHRA